MVSCQSTGMLQKRIRIEGKGGSVLLCGGRNLLSLRLATHNAQIEGFDDK